ncbi:hypothetical protein OsJ_03892 [Oryza sativa Japonica Group]|uniref:Uncharacterized protein n=1 Tax=Oryza sativa subsp. japonica TaxID=39947 RepID=B9ETX3_ORYSJ|nr:hypothetical protein OsJ_03892 [Oryza sativa Japonica Group]
MEVAVRRPRPEPGAVVVVEARRRPEPGAVVVVDPHPRLPPSLKSTWTSTPTTSKMPPSSKKFSKIMGRLNLTGPIGQRTIPACCVKFGLTRSIRETA